jgi:hypothetical protein
MRLTIFRLGLVVSFLTAVACGEPANPAPASPLSVPALSGKLGAPIQLFNGTDFTGWTWFQKPPKAGTTAPVVTRDEVFSIKNGVLHSVEKPTGYLRTDKAFDRFILTVEERHVTKGNGGLLVGIGPQDKVWPGLEIQTMTGFAGDLWNHNKLKLGTDPARTQNTHILRAGPDSQKPVGEWEIMEVVVDGGNLVFKVNGVVQNVAVETESLAGRVGLQVEGAEMEFRKVQLTPIEPKTGSNASHEAAAK